QVVDVGGLEGEVHAGLALDLALALEVADAAAEQVHLGDRELGGLGGRPVALPGRLLGGGGRDDPDRDGGGEEAGAGGECDDGTTHDRVPPKGWGTGGRPAQGAGAVALSQYCYLERRRMAGLARWNGKSGSVRADANVSRFAVV